MGRRKKTETQDLAKFPLIIHKKNIRSVVSQSEISEEFFEEFNRQCLLLLLRAGDRCRENGRRRLARQDA